VAAFLFAWTKFEDMFVSHIRYNFWFQLTSY